MLNVQVKMNLKFLVELYGYRLRPDFKPKEILAEANHIGNMGGFDVDEFEEIEYFVTHHYDEVREFCLNSKDIPDTIAYNDFMEQQRKGE
jgi:hypothetical protein